MRHPLASVKAPRWGRRIGRRARPGHLPVLLLVCGLTLTLLVGGCGFADGPRQDESRQGSWDVRPGAIVFYEDSSSIQLASDTVRAGQTVSVTANTFGGACTRHARTEATVLGSKAVIAPFDSVYTPGPEEACTRELKVISHTADVTFDDVGPAEIVLRGIGDGPRFDGPEDVELKRSIEVIE